MNTGQQTLNLFITYVDKEGPFLKVWGQTEKNNSLYVEQLLLGASQQFEQGIGEVPLEALQVGTIVCAKYKDTKYYRARIANIDFRNRGFVEVNFIDYGNRDFVPVDNIRSLDFPSSFISIPPLATSFIFAEAHCPGGGEWKDQIFEVISKELRFREVQCQLITQATHYYLVKLYIETTDLGGVFISRGLLQPIPLNAQQAVLLSMSLQKKPQPQVVQAMPPPPEINTFKACTLEPLQQYAVYVSFINEGPTHFSVQLKQTEDLLAKLMKEVNAVNLRLLEDIPLPGTICLARCQEDDNVCRAVVTNEVDNQFKIFYVDFGNYETVPLECLYQIPFKYVLPKVMAIRVALNGVEKSTVTMEMLLAFKKFVDNRLLFMKVLPSVKKTAIPKCELWDPETKTSALDVINRAAQNAYPEPLPLNRGLTLPVKVTYVFSCNRFYVQLLSKEQELSKLMDDLQVSCQTSDPVVEIKSGLPCCALFPNDQLWYRSEIVEVIDPENVKVRYIDYGNEEIVPFSCLKSVEGELLTVLRPQAIECCLNGYQNIPADDTRDALLEGLILEQSFTMKVNEMFDKKALVDLIDSNNYNVASLLLDKIAASKSQVSPMLVQAGNTLEHRKSSDSMDGFKKKPAREWGKNERNDTRNFDKGNDKPWRNENRDRENDTNRNDRSTDGDSWRQNNKGFNRNERNDRDWGDRNQKGDRSSANDRLSKFKDKTDRGSDNRNNNWNNKSDRTSSWSSPVNETAPTADAWGDSAPSPVSNSFENRRPRDDKFGGRRKFEDRGDRQDRSDRQDRGNWQDRGDRGNWHDRSDRQDRGDRNDRGGWNNKDGFKKDFKKDFRKPYGSKNKRDGSEVSSSGSEKSFRKGPRTSSRNDFGGGRGYQKKENTFDSNSWNVSDVSTPIDAAANDATFDKLEVVGTEAAVVVSWFHNPSRFYCQLQSSQPEFKTLMEEIQEFYKNRKNETCVSGAPVVGQFPEDNVLYRAQILEALGGEYKVFYVDFGNISTISKVWPIEKKFMAMPAQAVCCSLSGVGPKGDSWPDPSEFAQFFGKEFYMARFLSKDETDKVTTELWDNQQEVSQILLQANLAVSVTAQSEGVDIPLLLNQQLRVILKSVNNLSDIIVSLESGLALTCKAHNVEMASELFEDALKEYLDQTLIIYVDNVLDNSLLDVTFYDNDGNKVNILTPDEGALDNVDPLCPPLVTSSQLYGFVSHANDTAVFIQPSIYADQISSLLDRMFEKYSNVTEENSIIPEEGFVYAVNSDDGNWYRGRVENFDDATATVFYVDYGNTENVSFNVIRALDSEFNVPCMICVQVTLSSGSGLSLLEKDVVASIYYGETGWEGTVVECPQQSQIIPEEAATYETIVEAEPPQNIVTEPIGGDSVVVEEKTEELTGVNPAVLQENVLLEQPGAPVRVSHIDSPTQFYVQFFESSNDLEALQAYLQENEKDMPVLENISVGVLCAAPYSLDHNWYRAEVLDADEDITTVRFVDYGNTDVINNATTQVKTLPSHLLSLALYASRCSLKLKAVDEEWSEQALELFNELVNDSNVTAEFIIQDEKTNIVELYSNGVNVKDVLISKNLAIPCEIGTGASCFVSHLNSPSEFWVQMENCISELEWIAEQLTGAENFPELEDLTPGTLCAALFSDDDMWYRARILSNTVAGIELIFIDYGNSSISTSLRQLPEDLVATPALAQKCSLLKPEGIPYWTKQAQDKFSELSADGATIFALKKITTGETAVVDLFLNGECIVPKILPATVNGFVRNFENLHKFYIEKDGELLPEPVCLEPMPSMEWDDASNDTFRKLYPDGTLFQVELVAEDCVRLYKDAADIRPNLGGVKAALNLSNTLSEKSEDLVSSEDNVITYEAEGDSSHSNAVEPEEVLREPENICKDESLKDSQADSGNHSEPDVALEVIEKPNNPEKRSESSCEDHEPELAATIDKIADVVPEKRPESSCEDHEPELAATIDEIAEVVPAQCLEKPVEKEESRPPSTERPPTRHDERIIPGHVSRPHSPLPDEDDKSDQCAPAVSRPSSSEGRRISHDDKILPAVLSRPQTPIPESENN